MKFDTLVLSGGGSKGLGIVGALYYAYEIGWLKNINEYWGTSIGSIISLLLCVGYEPFEIFHKFFMMDEFANIYDVEFDVFTASGLYPIELFGKKIEKFVRDKIPPEYDLTFNDLYTCTSKNINIIGANATEMKSECFNYKTHPNMNIIEAIEISCDLPGVFTRKHYNGHIYADGGFVNNYPINYANNGINIVLGICIVPEFKNIPDNAFTWIYKLCHLPMLELYKERTKNLGQKCLNVELYMEMGSILEMSPSKEVKLEMFSSGYKQCKGFIQKYNEERDQFSKYINEICKSE